MFGVTQYVAIAGLIGVMAAGGVGYWQGHKAGAASEATKNATALRRTQERLHKTADSLSEANARLQAAQAEQDDLIRRIEDETRADADPCRAPSDRSLSRLKWRWGSAN